MKRKLWNNIPYELKDNIFNKEILKKFLNEFYENIVINLSDDQHILFIFRIELVNSDIKTTTKLLKINNESKDKDSLINYLIDAINLTQDNYNNSPISSLIISYGIRKGKIKPTISKTDHSNLANQAHIHIYYNHKLPIALKAEDYGEILQVIGQTTIVSFKKNIILIIEKEQNKNHIKYIKNGKTHYEWIDHIKEDNSLIREIGKTTILWKDGEIIWTKKLKITKSISKKRLSSASREDFITMDIETIGINKGKGSLLTPYLLCWYDGAREQSHSYFIDPSLGEIAIRNIIYSAMRDICIRKYKGYKIYLHNFSKFDAIFLVKYLVMIGSCDPVIHKGKIISFSFKPNWKKDFGSIIFLDSYLLLPNSLRKLGDSFSIETVKSIFPILLNNINYQGAVPNFDYFNNISSLEYKEYKESYKKIWNFKEESVKYCILDCKSLYQILIKFNKLIFEKFNLNIVDHPTLSSLAYNIFISSFYKKEIIHQSEGVEK